MKMNQDGTINYNDVAISKEIDKNIKYLQEIFKGDETIRYREIDNKSNRIFLVNIDGMVNTETLNTQIRTLQHSNLDNAINNIFISDLKESSLFSDAINSLLSGDSIILIDNHDKVFAINSKGFQMRSIQEPDNEQNLYGPREGFIENIMVNISMIRRKIQNSDLKVKFFNIGTRTNTKVAIMYLKSLAKAELISDIEHRLLEIKIDGILESNYIEELITKYPYTFFPTVGRTERPDKAVAKLLDGGLIILVDGTPLTIYLPYLFVENFHSSDDFYQNFYVASFNRILRYLAFFIAIFVAPIYIAYIGYHHDMLPTDLAISINAAITGVPMSVFIECISFLILFEMLRETGLRMSSKIGQALSIAGALIIGQAAVEAKIVSAPMVIIIAISAVAGLMIPKVSNTIMIYRFIAIIMASLLGLLGLTFVLIALFINICSLDSFGYQYSSDFISLHLQDFKDAILRFPMKLMKTRPKNMAKDQEKMK